MAIQKTIYTLRIDRHEVRLRRTAAGIQVKLERGTVIAAPGAPALPVRLLRVALPKGHKASAVSARVLSVESLTRANARVVPVIEIEEGTASPSPVTSTPDLYERAFQKSRQRPVWMAGQSTLGEIPMATVLVQAVRFGPDHELELIREVEITVKHKATSTPAVCRPASFLLRQHALARSLAVNPGRVDEHPHPQPTPPPPPNYPGTGPVGPAKQLGGSNIIQHLPSEIDYLIVTDHRRWIPDGPVSEQVANVPPDGDAPGSLRTEFEKLAEAKRARGLRVHTVCLSDVVAGDYGDFSTGARDVQEVLRNFLKAIVAKFDVEYVLLGGDHSIIPPRLLCGCSTPKAGAGPEFSSATRPDADCYTWSSDGVLLVHLNINEFKFKEDEGDWWSTTGKKLILTMYNSGQYVPYIPSPNSEELGAPRWFYCTDNTYGPTASENPTQYVRAEGLKEFSGNDRPWFYARRTNLIPSDLYYASLYAEVYNQPGKHDWDTLDNGLYGQWCEDEDQVVHDLGGGNLYRNVHVGRAPVSTAAEAAAFVDKVLAYENAPAQPDTERFNRMVISASNWGDYDYMEPKVPNTGVPLKHEFVSGLANNRSLLHTTTDLPNNPSAELFAYPTDESSTRTLIPYDPHPESEPNKTGWYFAIASGDLGVSTQATEWIVVYSNDPALLNPKSFGFDVDINVLDDAADQSEDLYEKMQTYTPAGYEFCRLYTDDSDVTNSPETVLQLAGDALVNQLSLGPNLYAGAGHGGRAGIKCLNTDLVHNLANSGKPFVAFVDSCWTAAFDFDDGLGEALVTAADAGAVAYMGFSHISSTGKGYELQHGFFESLQKRHHLGDVFDSVHMYIPSEISNYRWHLYALNLLGDPEMIVYRNKADLQEYFVGNRHTGELHKSNCLWAKRIWTGHEIEFEALNDGLEAGYDGCYYCLPEHHTR